MKVNLPRTDHLLTRLTASVGSWSRKVYVGRPYRDHDIEIPAGIDETEVEVIAEPCDGKGVAADRIVLKAGKAKVQVQDAQSNPNPAWFRSTEYLSQNQSRRGSERNAVTRSHSPPRRWT